MVEQVTDLIFIDDNQLSIQKADFPIQHWRQALTVQKQCFGEDLSKMSLDGGQYMLYN